MFEGKTVEEVYSFCLAAILLEGILEVPLVSIVGIAVPNPPRPRLPPPPPIFDIPPYSDCPI